MGQAPPSKPLKEPARPFKREQRRACLQHTFVPKPQKDPTVLLHLISRRDWQKVLIRVTLFPSEVTHPQKMTWYGVEWSLIPLHLACALQPPSEVIAMLLRFHSDTARLRMNRCSPRPQKKKRRIWRRNKTTMKKKGLDTIEEHDYTLVQSMQGLSVVPKINTAPSSSSDDEKEEDHRSHVPHIATMETEKANNRTNHSDSGSLLDDEAFAMEGDQSLHVFETYDDDASTDSEDDHPSAFGMPPEMLPNYEEAPAPEYAIQNGKMEAPKKSSSDRGVALQLSSNGSLEPLSVNSKNAVAHSKMQWNLDPLLMEADALLPLHIACLYRASPSVIAALLEAYSKGVQDSALGMLPIHMVCANFELPPPLLAPPPGPVPFPHDDEFDMVESIRRLERAFPESLDYPSESNGMTPKTYIDETLDGGPYKDSCLEALGIGKEEPDEEVEDDEEEEYWDMDEVSESKVSEYDNTTLTTRPPDEVHCDDDNSTLPSYQTDASTQYLGQDLPQINGFSGSRLYTQMMSKDWERALATIEERPKEARKWQYGIELDRIETSDSAIMWKRLPIHSACVLRAPIGLVEALLWAYPKGIQVKDPFTEALPLHMACRHSAPPELVKSIVMAYPAGSRIPDAVGRLPLHQACLSGASRLTFIYLLKAYPHAVLIKDDQRRTPLKYAKHNPTLKAETVELLELVHHFLEKQPAVEDDYIFEGFSAPHSVYGSDDGSTVSSFYQESFSVGRRPSPLSGSPSSGSRRSSHEDTNVDKLADEFSQILEEDIETPDGEEDLSGRLTPRFGTSRLRANEQNRLENSQSSNIAIETANSLIQDDDNSFEPDSAIQTKASTTTLSKPVSLHGGDDDERNAEASPGESTPIADDVGSEGPDLHVEVETGAAVTLAKLVFLTSKSDTEEADTAASSKSERLSKELSQILEEESSAADEESPMEGASTGDAIKTSDSLVAVDMGESTSAPVPSTEEESPLDRLSKLLMTTNDDSRGQTSSVACLDGDGKSGSDSNDQFTGNSASTMEYDEPAEAENGKPSVNNTAPDESPRSTLDFPQEFSTPDEIATVVNVVETREQTETKRSVDDIQEVAGENDDGLSADNETGTAVPDKIAQPTETSVSCTDETDAASDDVNTISEEESPVSCADEKVADTAASKMEAPSSDQTVPVSTIDEDAKMETHPTPETLHNVPTEATVDVVPSAAKEDAPETDVDSALGSIPSPMDDRPSPMVFDPADVAAGCSPLTLPTIEVLKRGHSEATMVTNNRSTAHVKQAGTAKYVSLEDEASIRYEPLVDDTKEAEARSNDEQALTASDHSPSRIQDDAIASSTTCEVASAPPNVMAMTVEEHIVVAKDAPNDAVKAV